MFVYFYLTAQVIEEKMRMWTADEEIAECRSTFIFDCIQKTNSKKGKKRVIKWSFITHNQLTKMEEFIDSISREEQRNNNLEKRSSTLDLSAHHFEDIGMN